MKKNYKRKKTLRKPVGKILSRSFTLMELIIVIAIVVILSATVAVGFITSLKKGRDARRKVDLAQIKGALESYYEDNLKYPPSPLPNTLCHPDGCATRKYMTVIPIDPKTKLAYYYETNPEGNYYKLYADLENIQDNTGGYSPGGYVGTDCNNAGLCNYGISSPNVTMAPTIMVAPTTPPTSAPTGVPTIEPTDIIVPTTSPTSPASCSVGYVCCNTEKFACCGHMGDVCMYDRYGTPTSYCCSGTCTVDGCSPPGPTERYLPF